jgi:hypothetical protein
MASTDVARLLAKEFVSLKIDIDRMIGGKDLLTRYCPKEMGIPWFVFLDESGAALATSVTGDGKNVGFPWEDFEIAHFKVMLQKTAAHLSASDIEALNQSLIAFRGKK